MEYEEFERMVVDRVKAEAPIRGRLRESVIINLVRIGVIDWEPDICNKENWRDNLKDKIEQQYKEFIGFDPLTLIIIKIIISIVINVLLEWWLNSYNEPLLRKMQMGARQYINI